MLAIMKMQISYQLLKHDLLLDPCHSTTKCSSYSEEPHPNEFDIIQNFTINDKQELPNLQSPLKYKFIYVARYLVKNYNQTDSEDEMVKMSQKNVFGQTFLMKWIEVNSHFQLLTSSTAFTVRFRCQRSMMKIFTPIVDNLHV